MPPSSLEISRAARQRGGATVCGYLLGQGEKARPASEGLRSPFFLRMSGTMLAAAVAVLLILGTGAAQPAQAQVESVLHSFTGPTSDGGYPGAGLIRDSSGNLYGTTKYGGSSNSCSGGCGTVFEMVYDSTTQTYSEKVLYNFTGSDGSAPAAGLIMDSSGNLYGTTALGGSNGDGTVFELKKSGSGYSSTDTVLLNFTGSDGAWPRAGLVMDSAGNLYGTTLIGGSTFVSGGSRGDGTVFELKKSGSGYSSTDTVLLSFNYSNGAHPYAGLTMDSAGNFYSTTYDGGSWGDGTVFELTPPAVSGGTWTEKVLFSFGNAYGFDGINPEGGLTMDAAGNLYGTTESGATGYAGFSGSGNGTVFELQKTGSGYASTQAVLLKFDFSDGAKPKAGLTMDAEGNLYGTTSSGGSSGDGTVFELKKNAPGYSSTATVLLDFSGPNGSVSYAGLTMDSAGNLYGTTVLGGSSYRAGIPASGEGTVLGIAPVNLSASSLSFGSVAFDTTSAVQTVTVTNIGGGQFSYSAASLSGANAADFSLTNDCSAAVAPGATCTVSVTFTPSTGTAETATLNLSQGGMTQTISLSGTGAYPTATLSPNLTFPETLVGTSSAPQTVTLTNTSASAALTIDSISVSANFTQTSTTCGASLAAGNSCTIDVAFSPTTLGSLTGTLTVTDNTSSGSQSVNLSGTSLTTVQYVQDVMIPQVESLGLNGGQTHSLVKELQDAAKLISEGKISGAIGNLEQFIAEVNDLYSSGILTQQQATTLIGEANSVIKQL